MNTIETEIPEVLVFQPRVFDDDRGFLFESFRSSWLPGFDFVQDNHSRSSKGTLRGLHYQFENTQGKLVRVTRGEVFDVAVDIRQSSPTYGQWVGRTLSDVNKEIFWVPPGFAHGFLVLSDVADFVYRCTDYYAPGDEYAIRWDDPELAINWPEAALPPTLSEKDQKAPLLADAKLFP
ncbi:MAG: dTDP-4-dehydrorhamnose 3,5-epimerase [Pseudomonadales bacterium]|nr:dTDP-4-dehydrorhamnose 3,5-epimerase [Pseudomonadales bacterium]MBO6596146.1 dTDP-4-dehydrorhamnose 3,5-epimerase [Pseudomonadales bacterium]MBO6822626.1 dTDP-4-dehydrorhamnose 3,5-epimerase [Pseudomonadales bacterium]